MRSTGCRRPLPRVGVLMLAWIAAAWAAEPPVLEVAGAEAPLPLSAERLQQMPRARAVFTAGEPARPTVYEGVALRDLLAAAGVPGEDGLPAGYANWMVTLTAADGYRVTFRLAELKPGSAVNPVILADTRNAAPLPPSEGPLRIVAVDERRGRWIRQVVRIKAGPGGARGK